MRRKREERVEEKNEGEAPASPRSSRNADLTFNAGRTVWLSPGAQAYPVSPAPQAAQLCRPPLFPPSLPACPGQPRSGPGRPSPPGPAAPGCLPRALPSPGLTLAQLPLPHADDERRVLAVVDEPQAQGLHALLRVAQLRQLPFQRRLRERRHRCTALGPTAPSWPGRAALSPRLSAPMREEPRSDSQPFSPQRQRPAPTKWRRPRRAGPPPSPPALTSGRGRGAREAWSGSVRDRVPQGWGQHRPALGNNLKMQCKSAPRTQPKPNSFFHPAG